MIIYSNEHNPALLKLLIALKAAKQSADVKFIKPGDKIIPKPSCLPYIELDDGRRLFSSNAAVQYLNPIEKSDEELVRQWLEFEACELAPNAAFLIGSASKADKVKTGFENALKTLNSALTDKYLNKRNVTLADTTVWSTLYPIYSDKELTAKYLGNLPNVLSWLALLEKENLIQDALKEFKLSTPTTCYQALLAGAKYPAMNFSDDATNQQPANKNNLPDEPTNEEIEAAKLAWIKSLSDLPQRKPEAVPSLPVPGEKNVLITSALPYVNNVPHLGNIIGCVLSADVFARFSRLCNWNTLYIGGTDEYGTATETKALEEGLTPQQICDKYFDIHNNIYRWFNIGFDFFGRTTHPEQTKLVQGMFTTLNTNGFMQVQPVEQLLCEKCNRYLADRFVEGGCPHPGCNYEDARGDQCDACGKLVNATELKNPKCKICKSTPVVRISNQFFLDLPKLEPLLIHWMNKSSPGWTNNARVISRSWMKEGLKARCITRDLKWGVPVPLNDYRDKVFYVWFDAPLGYISMTEHYTKEWKRWWQPAQDTNVILYQFMAKDNVPFHSVMFPACLLGAHQGFTLVSHIAATEYLNYEDGKFSKSRGVGVFGNDAQSTGIASDVWRFYLLFIRPEGQDSSFSWVDLATKNNSELLNNLGNFVNRALTFCEKFFAGTIPPIKPNDVDYQLLALCARELSDYVNSLTATRLRDGIRNILAISKHGNQYMQSQQPWVLVKGTPEERERAGTVIGISCNLACLLATLMYPYMPEASRKLKAQINVPNDGIALNPDNPEIYNFVRAGHRIGKPAPLFAKIEAAQIDELRKKFGGAQQQQPNNTKANVATTPAAKQPMECGDVNVDKLNEEIEKQGMVVRKLKESGAPKSEWTPQVEILLALKQKLAAITGQPLAASKSSKKGKK